MNIELNVSDNGDCLENSAIFFERIEKDKAMRKEQDLDRKIAEKARQDQDELLAQIEEVSRLTKLIQQANNFVAEKNTTLKDQKENLRQEKEITEEELRELNEKILSTNRKIDVQKNESAKLVTDLTLIREQNIKTTKENAELLLEMKTIDEGVKQIIEISERILPRK